MTRAVECSDAIPASGEYLQSSEPGKWWSLGVWGISLCAHAGIFMLPASLSPLEPKQAKEHTLVRFETVSSAPLLEPEPEPEPLEQPEEAATTPPPPSPAPTVAPRPAKAETPPAAASPPVQELTGTTLTAEGDGGFSAERGSGRSRDGAIVPGASTPVVRKAVLPAVKPQVTPAPPPLIAPVPLKQLSRKPAPPSSLSAALRRNYPSSARAQGLSGSAQIRARIEPSGNVSSTMIASESSGGFGAACQKTLQGSKWTPPLDKTGRAVATWISYRCHFVVDQ